ncbi:MAG: hypothetical protein M0036_17195 [Desulfobacteraceae bacterium]|nr:hypothetical protein [Desulfobacteraceae bacterium]
MSSASEQISEHIVAAAIGLNLIFDIVERVRRNTGVVITPENIGAYIAERKAVREKLNADLGIDQG